MKFSIIMPIYNADRYLERAIVSVLNQTYPNWELLCIDDGSEDMSLSICQKFGEVDKRVRIFSKENSGVSDSRNIGIDNATGEKIIFLDADDYLDPRILEVFSKYSSNTSLLIANFYLIYENRMIPGREITYDLLMGQKENNNLIKFIISQSQWRKSDWYGNCRTVWGKCFTTDIIRENGIRFNQELKVGEDMLFFLTYVLHVNSVKFCHDFLYFHERSNENSVMNRNEWQGSKQGIIYFNSVERIVGSYLTDEEMSDLWLETAEMDWKNIMFSNLSIFTQYREFSKLYGSELYQRFSNHHYLTSSKKKKIYIFFIKNNMKLPLMILFKVRMKWLFYRNKI